MKGLSGGAPRPRRTEAASDVTALCYDLVEVGAGAGARTSARKYAAAGGRNRKNDAATSSRLWITTWSGVWKKLKTTWKANQPTRSQRPVLDPRSISTPARTAAVWERYRGHSSARRATATSASPCPGGVCAGGSRLTTRAMLPKPMNSQLIAVMELGRACRDPVPRATLRTAAGGGPGAGTATRPSSGQRSGQTRDSPASRRSVRAR